MVKKLRSPGVQNQLWTIISSGLGAVYTSLLLLLTTRLIGLKDAGILSYSVAISELLRMLVVLGVRNYQSTDIRQEFSFNTYLFLRTLSSLFAIAILIVVILVGRSDSYRVVVLVLFFFTYLTDKYADVFMGDLQQKGKMRIAGRMRAAGFGGALIAFAIVSFITHKLIVSLAFAGIAMFLINIAWVWFNRQHFGSIQIKADFKVIKKLTLSTLPIAISTSLFSYMYNAQKYYLGALGSDEDVAIIAILMQPAMLLYLFFSFFFVGAELTKMAEVFTSGQTKQFSRQISKLLVLVGGLSMLFIVCAYIFGLPLLSWLYGIDLSSYKMQFMLLSCGGLFFSVSILLRSVLIVMRMQRIALYCMVAVALVTGLLMWYLVSHYGFTGAAFSNLVIFAPLSIAYYWAYKHALLAKSQACDIE